MKITSFSIVAVMFMTLRLILNSSAQILSQKHLPEGAMARIGKGLANDVKYSPDGTQIAVASHIGIWIYDAQTYQEIDLFTEHSESVEGVAFSPDGQTLAGANRGGMVKLWDVDTGHLKARFKGSGGWLFSVAFSPDGQTLACADADELKLWDMATRQHKVTLKGHTSLVTSVVFSPDGQTLASSSWDKTVRLWNVNTGRSKRILTGHKTTVASVAYSPDGRTLASGSWYGGGGGDDTLCLWDADTGQLKTTVPGHSSGVAFSPDGRTLASMGWGKAILLDADTGELKTTLQGIYDFGGGVAFSPDGQTLAGVNYSRVNVWDVDTGQYKAALTGHVGISPNIAFSPDGQTLASTDHERVRLWDANTGQHKIDLPGHAPVQFYTHNSSTIAFSPDGQTLAGLNGPVVVLSDVSTGDQKTELIGDYGFQSVVFSPDGQILAAGHQTEVQLWDVNIGQQKMILQGPDLNGTVIAYSPDGRILATRSKETPTIPLWNTTTGELIKGLIGHTRIPRRLAFSSDGRTLVSGTYGELLIWDIVRGEQRGSLPAEGGCNAAGLALSPDGNILVTEWNGTDVMLWNVATYEQLMTFSGHGDQHQHQITSLAFNPNGNMIASSAVDGTVLLWDVTSFIPPVSGGVRFNPDTIADQNFTIGEYVSLTLPTATGGTAPYTYTLTPQPPAGLYFDTATRVLSGTPTTATPATTYTYTATDAAGAFATLTFTITVTDTGPGGNLDVNGDGQVNVLDLILVAVFYGTRGDGLPADVNADGVVNVDDFAAVAAAVDAAGALPLQAVEAALLAAAAQAGDIEAIAGAPVGFGNPHQHTWSRRIAYRNVAAALADVRLLAASDARLGKGVALLAELLQLLKEMNAIPETTALLPNYPNPFNPETWIPYHLATDAAVTLAIYNVRGVAIRTLTLGQQSAGVYESRGRAAYWDGRNALGEPVASGVYFYTLTAGEFTATRKLLIAK